MYHQTKYKYKQLGYQHHATLATCQQVFPHNIHSPSQWSLCQIMYKNQIHSVRPSINTVLTTAHCASVRPHSSHTRLKILLQPSRASSRLSTCCWLWQLTACPFFPIKWKEDKMGRERDLLLRNGWYWVSNVMSSALSWNYHNMLRGIVMYCLPRFPSYHFRTASHFEKIFSDYYAIETISNPHPLISYNW